MKGDEFVWVRGSVVLDIGVRTGSSTGSVKVSVVLPVVWLVGGGKIWEVDGSLCWRAATMNDLSSSWFVAIVRLRRSSRS